MDSLPLCTCRGQRATLGVSSFLSLWAPGIELGSSGLLCKHFDSCSAIFLYIIREVLSLILFAFLWARHLREQLRGGKVNLVPVHLSRTSVPAESAGGGKHRKQRRKERTGRKAPGTRYPQEPTPSNPLPSARPHHLTVTETPQIASPAGNKAPNTWALVEALNACANCGSVLFQLFDVTKTVHGTAVCGLCSLSTLCSVVGCLVFLLSLWHCFSFSGAGCLTSTVKYLIFCLS